MHVCVCVSVHVRVVHVTTHVQTNILECLQLNSSLRDFHVISCVFLIRGFGRGRGIAKGAGGPCGEVASHPSGGPGEVPSHLSILNEQVVLLLLVGVPHLGRSEDGGHLQGWVGSTKGVGGQHKGDGEISTRGEG